MSAARIALIRRARASEKAIRYAAISVYLAIAGHASSPACSRKNTQCRAPATDAASPISSAPSSPPLSAAIGYFNAFPGAVRHVRAHRPRARHLQGPQCLRAVPDLPTAFLIYRMLTRGIRLHRSCALLGILLFGLLLSFSRGAWFHFAVSGVVLVGLDVSDRARPRVPAARLIALGALAIAALRGLLVALLSFDSIGDMFQERAHLIQSYDVGTRRPLPPAGARARLSARTSRSGMGPFEFARVHGLQQHNIYLQAFLVYGWLGGTGLCAAVAVDTWVGLRSAFVRTPWQPYAITALCGLRRRSGGRLRDRHRSLAALLPAARDDLGYWPRSRSAPQARPKRSAGSAGATR